MTTHTGEQHGSGLPLTVLLQDAKDVMVEHLHERLVAEGFTGIRFWHGAVFRVIDADGTRLTVLAQRSGFTKQAIGEVVGELERLGYVERTADPQDGRAKIIRLTARGVEAQVAAQRILGDIERRWEQHLGRERIVAMRRTLDEIHTLERGPQHGG